MNIRTRKIIFYRVFATVLLILSIGLTIFALAEVIMSHPEKIILDCITLGLTIVFPIGQIILILKGGKKESHLLDIAYNTDNTINKVFLVFVLVGATLGVGLDVLTIVVLTTRANTVAVFCSMMIIMSIATYLLFNTIIYLVFTLVFRKRELTLKDYAK